MRFRISATLLGLLALLLLADAPSAQRAGLFQGSADDPNIQYSTGTLDNAVDRLNQRIDAGALTLAHDGEAGYLASVLKALDLHTDSQLLVFSKGSLQGRRINQQNPRAIYFGDSVAVGFVRGGDALEIAAQDAKRGVVFYTVAQKPGERARFKREMICLGCHMTGDTHGVPGLLMFSTTPETERAFGSIVFTRHTLPLARRFGGWLVTGTTVAHPHLGNGLDAVKPQPAPGRPATAGLYPQEGYLSHTSDAAALMVFAHQAGMVDQLVRANWEGLMAGSAPPAPGTITVLSAVAADLVDSLLFIDEARFDGRIEGSSGFAERFEAMGPADDKGRTLRALDLRTRLLKYPCSYLIYSPLFDGLPPVMKTLVYKRLWEVLSGREQEPRYRTALTLADRRAIVEILRSTKAGLPDYFQPVTR